jgi:hypothetical protein
MQFSEHIIIPHPIKLVNLLFDNPNNIAQWQPEMQWLEVLEGKLGEVGCKSKVRFNNPFMSLDMTETIVAKQKPHTYISTYQSDGVINTVTNTFEAIDDKHTKYTTQSQFEFTNIFMQMGAMMIVGMFQSQSKKYLQSFKQFCDTELAS